MSESFEELMELIRAHPDFPRLRRGEHDFLELYTTLPLEVTDVHRDIYARYIWNRLNSKGDRSDILQQSLTQ